MRSNSKANHMRRKPILKHGHRRTYVRTYKNRDRSKYHAKLAKDEFGRKFRSDSIHTVAVVLFFPNS